MKQIRYPLGCNVFALKKSAIAFLSILFSIFFSATAIAKTVVIGSGSGNVSQTSMAGLSAGDVLAIAPGSYSGATFSGLNNVSIINNGGVVTFTGTVSLGSGLVNVTISGTGYSAGHLRLPVQQHKRRRFRFDQHEHCRP